MLLVLITVFLCDRLGLYYFNQHIDIRRVRVRQNFPLNDIGIREDLNLQELVSLQKEKIILLGNSVVYGFREPDRQKTVAGALQSVFDNAKSQKAIKVINAGLDGENIWTEFPFLKDKLLKANPKIVVWIIGPNDFESRPTKQDAAPYEERINANGTKTRWYELSFYRELSRFLFLQLNVFISDWNTNSEYDMNLTATILKNQDEATLTNLSGEIQQLGTQLKQRNVQFLAVFIPTRHFNKNFEWKDANSFVKLESILNTLNIPHVQFFENFKSDCEDCFIDYEHFNEKGNLFFAKLLHSEIQKRYLY